MLPGFLTSTLGAPAAALGLIEGAAAGVAKLVGGSIADGRAYGFERAMDNLGAILGPLLAIVLWH